ncbi:CBS domain-containing protein [Haloarcula hispanica]|uniref:CBS domain-containing protein n=1 Tax=Haloarcula hispanica TaxID=51589 RepID=A0A482SWR9_HALHI|nr:MULTISPECIES: CBS domain-containing protein [Haloarcula]MCJ0621398.1 CBS domain-containing protein [Haloarcula hispanica]MUV50262.1 CBS domain-containing protein [Haloarcula sp. CBA1122]RYJ07688.1 CBS domain-containing protein [Haloarcula hispanica]
MAFPIRVNDVMSSPVETASPETTASTAAGRCHAGSIGSLVVVEDGEVLGIVTSDDFVRLLSEESSPEERSLSEFMSTHVVSVDASATLGAAVETMFEHDIARLVVFDGDELVGLVSTDDIVRHVPQILQRREIEGHEQQTANYYRHQETAYEKNDWDVEGTGLDDHHVNVGDRVEFSKTISEQDVRTFAAASGDTNRLHLDEEYASQTRFGRRIVHGTLVGGLISAALARFPGVTIYISQDLSFLKPADIDVRLTAVCEVVEDLGRNKYQLTTDVLNEDGEPIIEGQAAVLIDETPETGQVTVEVLASG